MFASKTFLLKTLRIMNRWPLAPCESGKVVATVPTGESTDAAAFDPKTRLAFASNSGDRTLTVIEGKSANQYEVVSKVKMHRGVRTMALDTKTHAIYLSDADLGPAPAAATSGSHPWPRILPGTFKLLVVSQ